jgi:hypothetical protein
MINIDQGHSHAFYWKAMNAQKFKSEQFRIAITVCRKDGAPASFSVFNSIEAYSRMLKKYGGQEINRMAGELDQILLISRGGFEDCPEAQEGFRQDLIKKLSTIRRQILVNRAGQKETDSIRHASEMIERIIREVKEIG